MCGSTTYKVACKIFFLMLRLQPRSARFPNTTLFRSVQALVLDTLTQLQRDRRISMVIVSHDLGVIRTLADRVMVMRHGQFLEQGLVDQVFQDPQHPYTQQLVHAKL